MKNLPLLDNTANFMGTKLPQIVNGNGSVQTSQETYTLANGDAPTVMYRWVFSFIFVLGARSEIFALLADFSVDPVWSSSI